MAAIDVVMVGLVEVGQQTLIAASLTDRQTLLFLLQRLQVVD